MCLGGQRSEAIVVVDPYSTGSCIAREASKRGYNVIALWSHDISPDNKFHVPSSCADLVYFAVVDSSPNSLEETVNIVKQAAGPNVIKAVICGGEHGVPLADALSETLGLLTNGTHIPQRRDKKLQQELVKAAGLRSVRQAGGRTMKDVEEFLRTESYPVVVKPVESAGSEGVKLCHTYEEAEQHFHLLMNSQRKVGSKDGAVLCQEFLMGKEYVVDTVSRDGVHKTVMIWVYDKRQANGAAFVYFGILPVDSESPEAKLLIPYALGVVDALQIRNGATHCEIMMTADGPCLVELNARAHGGDGNWQPLTKALCGGYSQVDATVDAYLNPDKFFSLPDKPPSPFLASGQEVKLVSYSKGIVKATPAFEIFRMLPSFVLLQTMIDVGSEVDYSTDLFTCIGGVILMHKDSEVVKRDHQFIRYAEEVNALFVYETKQENLIKPHHLFAAEGPSLIRHFSNDLPEFGAPLMKRMTTVKASEETVIVVNPFSIGAHIAQELSKRTFRVIALWTKAISETQRQSSVNFKAFANVDEREVLEETLEAIQEAAEPFRVVACICGGEEGSSLTDAVSEKLGLRTNGTQIKNRENRKIQQELIQEAGLRSVRQATGVNLSDDTVNEFLLHEKYPIVVKPADFVGPDGVKLCHDIDEAKDHFSYLVDLLKKSGLDASVICQEYLKGKEYMIDHVSRDGVHKTTMIWVYDKQSANGSNGVYFGMLPVAAESSEARMLIPYVRWSLDALGVKNGPSQAEVIMTPDGPVLVGLNVRCHGDDGTWIPLARALTGGYTQVEATVDAFLDQKHFYSLPDAMPKFKSFGQLVTLVSYSRGSVASTPGYDVIQQLPSFFYLETSIKEGSEVNYTTDLFTNVGRVILVHREEEVLKSDVAKIRQMEKDNTLFQYKVQDTILKGPSSIYSSPRRGRGHQRLISSDRPEMYW
mmetsp:Transcript_3871/g.5772  ORF Transcript_3871/g.5772 Transcript_3871/m.5772 type:complete len:931 (-) Transcript_3871:263-3055(-)